MNHHASTNGNIKVPSYPRTPHLPSWHLIDHEQKKNGFLSWQNQNQSFLNTHELQCTSLIVWNMTRLSETFILWNVTHKINQAINQETVCRKKLIRILQTQSRTEWFKYRSTEVQESQVDNASFRVIVHSQRWGLQERWETVWLYWEHVERPWGKVNLLASKHKQALTNYSHSPVLCEIFDAEGYQYQQHQQLCTSPSPRKGVKRRAPGWDLMHRVDPRRCFSWSTKCAAAVSQRMAQPKDATVHHDNEASECCNEYDK